MALAWVLNLDADVELARPHGAGYTPSRAVIAAMAPRVAALACELVGPEDIVVDETSPPNVARGRVGRAFCPTPRAIALLERAGAAPEPHPSRSVLRSVNSRAFCAALGQTLPGAVFVDALEEAISVLSVPPPIGDGWRVKRAFGMAGRGQRRVAPRLDEGDLVFLRAAFAEAGVQIEPNLSIEREWAQHGRLDRGGALEIGRRVAQTCDARGQWQSSSIAVDADPAAIEIEIEIRRVGAALHVAGYFGPFGIDAFAYAGGLQPRSEINARYTMGFAAGFDARIA